MLNNKVVIVLLLFFTCVNCIAQKRLTLAGKVYKLGKFVTDTVPKPKFLAYLDYPSSIRRSSHDVEIRYYDHDLIGGMTTLYAIKGNADSLILEKDQFAAVPFSKLAHIIPSKTAYTIYLLKRTAIHQSLVDSLLSTLIAQGIFVQIDQHQILKELATRQVKLNKYISGTIHPSLDLYFEIKAGNRYRSFTCNPDPAEVNQQIKSFISGMQLFQTFNKLHNSMFTFSKQKSLPNIR